jgi:hypothetical protein
VAAGARRVLCVLWSCLLCVWGGGGGGGGGIHLGARHKAMMLLVSRGSPHSVMRASIDAGTEVDLHSAHWHGNTLLQIGDQYRTDAIMLLPRLVETADMTALAAGTWLFHW